MVVGVQQSPVLGDESQLGGGGAGVDAQPGGPLIGLDVHLGRALGVVPGAESAVLGHVLEQGGHGVHQGGGVHTLLQLFQGVLKENGVIVRRTQGRAHGGKAVAVLGENGVLLIQFQGLHKPLPQAHEEVEGAAQKDDLALQLPALGEAGHRLVHHRLEDGGGHVLLPPALVQDGLDVALGKHSAAGGDGVDLLMLQREGVQLIHRHVHQGCHLVDEGAGAAGAGAVHPLLQGAAEEDDLGVLAPQLDDRVGPRYVGVHRRGGGVHLLNKVDPGGVGHSQSGGAGNDHLHLPARQHVGDGPEGLAGPLPGLGVVPLIGAEQQLVLFVQHHHLDRGGADVDADTKTHKLKMLLTFVSMLTD